MIFYGQALLRDLHHVRLRILQSHLPLETVKVRLNISFLFFVFLFFFEKKKSRKKKEKDLFNYLCERLHVENLFHRIWVSSFARKFHIFPDRKTLSDSHICKKASLEISND